MWYLSFFIHFFTTTINLTFKAAEAGLVIGWDQLVVHTFAVRHFVAVPIIANNHGKIVFFDGFRFKKSVYQFGSLARVCRSLLFDHLLYTDLWKFYEIKVFFVVLDLSYKSLAQYFITKIHMKENFKYNFETKLLTNYLNQQAIPAYI